MVESYRDLIVWQRSVQMTVAIYRLTVGIPKEEIFGLTSQLRRAAVSVASNVAEGYRRTSPGEFRQFLGMARGSNLEVQTQLLIAGELDYGNTQELKQAEGISMGSKQDVASHPQKPLKLFVLLHPTSYSLHPVLSDPGENAGSKETYQCVIVMPDTNSAATPAIVAPCCATSSPPSF